MGIHYKIVYSGQLIRVCYRLINMGGRSYFAAIYKPTMGRGLTASGEWGLKIPANDKHTGTSYPGIM